MLIELLQALLPFRGRSLAAGGDPVFDGCFEAVMAKRAEPLQRGADGGAVRIGGTEQA